MLKTVVLHNIFVETVMHSKLFVLINDALTVTIKMYNVTKKSYFFKNAVLLNFLKKYL